MLACQAAVPFCRNVDLDDRCCKLHALLKSLAPDSGTAMRGLVVKSKSRWSDRDGDLRRREECYPAVQVRPYSRQLETAETNVVKQGQDDTKTER